MKLFNKIVTFSIFSILIFSACREEVTIDVSGQNDPAIKANTELAGLMQRTALKDGSKDNIIDNANCLSVKLPVTVIANGEVITVNTEDDYDLIEDIFDELDDDTDEIEIVFPITIVLNNFTEVMVTNLDDFDNFRNNCKGENEQDDDIECLDFQYPINATIFDTSTEQTDRITINNDKEMHDFIEDLDEDDIANITFPIIVLLFDGTQINIMSLNELESVINDAEDDCDEDDDYDYNDDDCNNCNQQQVLEILTNCSDWTVDKLELNDNDLEDNYMDYTFNFFNDGTITVLENSNSFSGTWSSSGNGNNITLIIDIPLLTDFNNNWIIHEIEQSGAENQVDLRRMNDRLRFESTCN